MTTAWIKHRQIVAAYYRSANAYTSLCRRQNLSNEGLSPIEIQIMEQIIEHADENNNMKWYAEQLGISTSAFTNYVNGLSAKELVDKYHTSGNRKNIILKLSERGMAAYADYAAVMQSEFAPMFRIMEEMSTEEQERVIRLLQVWGDQQLIGTEKDRTFTLVPVAK